MRFEIGERRREALGERGRVGKNLARDLLERERISPPVQGGGDLVEAQEIADQRQMFTVPSEIRLLAAVPIAGLDPVLVAVELVLESGSLSADHILNVLARLSATAPPPSVETSLQLKVAPVANTARYDQLRTTDEESRNA